MILVRGPRQDWRARRLSTYGVQRGFKSSRLEPPQMPHLVLRPAASATTAAVLAMVSRTSQCLARPAPDPQTALDGQLDVGTRP
jgi:hypothetical protein